MKRILRLLAVVCIIASQGQGLFAQNDSSEYDVRPFQMTFMFPPFSTNGIDNVNYINNFSLNTFIGVSGGVDGAELGGFINIDRYYVNGLQAAGFGNTVGGDMEGVQLAGFYNVAGGNGRYVQGAGFVNTVGRNYFGLQGAGFMNIVGGNLDGFEGAGFCNVVGKNVTGVQGAGFMNLAGDTLVGLQGAGFLNVARGVEYGAQAAGFGNISGSGKVNVQASGFFNIADEVSGIQAAGFFNRAGYVKGLQAAGFLNVCDSIDGIPVAFISIVKHNGYRRLEVSGSETEYVSLAFKMGVEKFYTIYKFGKPLGPGSRWFYGVGAGTQFDLAGNSFMNVELTSSQEIWLGDSRSPRFFHQSRYNSYNQLAVSYGRSLGGIVEFFVGPTLNVSIAHAEPVLDTFIPWKPIAPGWAFLDRTYNTYNQTNVAIWIGVKGGLRF
ncbi:hypothetical protein ACFLT1_00470 [Bacteroidota bacterium]